MNVNSLRAHIGRVRDLLSSDLSYHVFGIAETWLGPGVDDSIVQVDGYTLLRQDRNINGGGVALYVRKDLIITRLDFSNTTVPGRPSIPEYLFCTIQRANSPPVLVGVVYRPPNIAILNNTNLFDVLRDLAGEYSHKIIMGDFNANLLSASDTDANTFRDLFSELSMKLVEHGATHHTRNNTGDEVHTWIDQIWTDESDVIRGEPANLQLPGLGKHSVIDVTIDVFVQSPPKNSFTYRDYKSICPIELNERLSRLDWSAVEGADIDLEGALNCLNSNFTMVIDELAPLKTVNPRRCSAPWIGPELKQLIQKRNNIEKRYRRFQSSVLLDELLRLSNEVEVRTEQERTSFLQQHLTDALDEKKDIWKVLRNLGLLPRSKEEDLNGFSPEDLNSHFSGISISPDENSNDAMNTILNAPEEGFSFRSVGSKKVEDAIKHFTSQARGVDGVPQNVVVKSFPSIGKYLVKIFNSSFAQSRFPEVWKRAQVIALKKKSTPSSPSDFRPISLLCFFSKVLEKLAHDQITGYLTANNIIDPLQTGFRPNHSTHTALLKLTDDVRMAMDDSKKKVTLLLLFDFSKAFDTVSPSKLLSKLRSQGFSRTALMWIRSYLGGRSQQVTTRSSGSSDWLETNLGVPQGSVLGPLLFCLYVNDLPEVLNPMSGALRVNRETDAGDELAIKHIFYADDLQIYLHVEKKRYLEGVARLTEAARRVAEWAAGAGLRLSAEKTKAIIFGVERNLNDLKKLGLRGIEMGDGVRIPFSDEVVSLGVVLDSQLSWKSHVDQVAKKVNRALYPLRFLRAFTGHNQTLRKRLVEALVQPHLDYCAVVVLDASDDVRAVLQRLSNSCVRYITGVRRDAHITPYRRQLGLLTTDMRRYYFAALIMYKIRCMGEPSYLAEFFIRHQPRNGERGEVAEYEEGRFRINPGEFSFQRRCARFWNLLPPHIRNVDIPIGRFKRGVREYLFSVEGEDWRSAENLTEEERKEYTRKRDILKVLGFDTEGL